MDWYYLVTGFTSFNVLYSFEVYTTTLRQTIAEAQKVIEQQGETETGNLGPMVRVVSWMDVLK
jgi:hypothetical protein